MRLNVYSILSAALFLPLLLALQYPAAAENLRVGGVGTALGSMKLLAAAFEKKHPGTKVVIIPSLGSSGAAVAVTKGALDIGLMGRQLRRDEGSPEMTIREYARTPFVAVTRKDTGIQEITTEVLEKIYRGDTRTWPTGKQIRLVLRPLSDSDTALIRNISEGMSRALDLAHTQPGMLVATTDQDNADLLEHTPGSLGFSTLTQALSEQRGLRVMAFHGTSPSVKALASGAYPLFKPLFIVTRTGPSWLVKKFIDFVLSAEGKQILEASGNLPVKAR